MTHDELNATVVELAHAHRRLMRRLRDMYGLVDNEHARECDDEELLRSIDSALDQLGGCMRLIDDGTGRRLNVQDWIERQREKSREAVEGLGKISEILGRYVLPF